MISKDEAPLRALRGEGILRRGFSLHRAGARRLPIPSDWAVRQVCSPDDCSNGGNVGDKCSKVGGNQNGANVGDKCSNGGLQNGTTVGNPRKGANVGDKCSNDGGFQNGTTVGNPRNCTKIGVCGRKCTKIGVCARECSNIQGSGKSANEEGSGNKCSNRYALEQVKMPRLRGAKTIALDSRPLQALSESKYNEIRAPRPLRNLDDPQTSKHKPLRDFNDATPAAALRNLDDPQTSKHKPSRDFNDATPVAALRNRNNPQTSNISAPKPSRDFNDATPAATLRNWSYRGPLQDGPGHQGQRNDSIRRANLADDPGSRDKLNHSVLEAYSKDHNIDLGQRSKLVGRTNDARRHGIDDFERLIAAFPPPGAISGSMLDEANDSHRHRTLRVASPPPQSPAEQDGSFTPRQEAFVASLVRESQQRILDRLDQLEGRLLPQLGSTRTGPSNERLPLLPYQHTTRMECEGKQDPIDGLPRRATPSLGELLETFRREQCTPDLAAHPAFL